MRLRRQLEAGRGRHHRRLGVRRGGAQALPGLPRSEAIPALYHSAALAQERIKDRGAVVPYSNPASYDEFMGRWSRRLAPDFVAFAGIRGARRVLDAGCGTGMLARALLDVSSDFEVVGIEPNARRGPTTTASRGLPRYGKSAASLW